MAKEQRGRRGTTTTTQKQASRGTAGAALGTARAKTTAQGNDAKSADAWLAAIVFGTHETKMPVNIRLDADVVRYFRAGGPGYQTRINEVLKAFVQARIRAGEVPGAPPPLRRNGRKRAK